jgi:hypothetical protein
VAVVVAFSNSNFFYFFAGKEGSKVLRQPHFFDGTNNVVTIFSWFLVAGSQIWKFKQMKP